ncbi:MAG: helix-turn-helix domain-containing protein [Candidatus Bathyarchaeia archaeon]
MGINKNHILKLLERHPEGLSITMITRLLGSSKITVSKYIHELLGEEKIHQRVEGKVKLHYLKKNWEELMKKGG